MRHRWIVYLRASTLIPGAACLWLALTCADRGAAATSSASNSPTRPPTVPPAGSAQPAVAESLANSPFPFQQIGPGLFRLGKVTLDKTQRSVSYPATVNQRTGTVEYAVVTTTGKTHESVFRTEAQPEHVHLALLLLGAKPASTNQFPADLAIPPPGPAVGIEVSWNEDGVERRVPLEDFIMTTNNQAALPRGPWVFNGSFFFNGRFLAQGEGSLVSVHIDPGALVNSPRQGRDNDDLHVVNSAMMPKIDGPLTITTIISLPAKSAGPGESPNRPAGATQPSTQPASP